MPIETKTSPKSARVRAWLRYDVAFSAGGLVFPVLALVVTASGRHASLSVATLLQTHASDPALWIMDTLPIVFGALGFFLRRKHQDVEAKSREIAALEVERRESLRKTATELANASRDLIERVTSIMAACMQTSGTVHETFDTMNHLSGTATQAALDAETVIGIARRSERASQSASSVADATGTELQGLADDVRAMAEQVDALHKRLKDLGDVAAAMVWLSERSQSLAAIGASAACSVDVEKFHFVAEEMRGHADDAKFVSAQAQTIISEVTSAMEAAVKAADAGSRRASSRAQIVQQTGEKIRSLGVALRDSAASAAHIAQVAQQQSGAFDQVMKAMNEICLATESNVTETQAVAVEARALAAIATRLRHSVDASTEKDSTPARVPSTTPVDEPSLPVAAASQGG